MPKVVPVIAVVASLLTLVLVLGGDSIPSAVRLPGSVLAVLVAAGALAYSLVLVRRER